MILTTLSGDVSGDVSLLAQRLLVLQRKGLPKIAFIPEKEHIYLSIHVFDTSLVLRKGLHFYKINLFGNKSVSVTTLINFS